MATDRGVDAGVLGAEDPLFGAAAIAAAAARFRETTCIVQDGAAGTLGVAVGEAASREHLSARGLGVLAVLGPLYPEWLGDRAFTETHGLRFPYVAGEMANGIATPDLVVATAEHGMLGFFGAAGLAPERVERALVEIEARLGGSGRAWGANLIHSPAEPALEDAVADLYIRRRLTHVCASAYMGLTPAVVRCAASGLTLDTLGRVRRARHVFAKVSRPEVARRFLSPAPADILAALVADGKLTLAEASLAARVPLAEDVTVEADSGGHTDNRPLAALLPTIQKLAVDAATTHGYARPIRVGAAGGIGTPSAVASAFALGAAYVLTGSINQAALESGLSREGKRLLAEAGLADVAMAPAADMFEMGVKVQVLKRGTLFAARATRLYEAWNSYDSIDAIPPEPRSKLEREVLGQTIDSIWQETAAFFAERDPGQLERADSDRKHKLALVCRWYLGKSSKWAISGDPQRKLDYQIWCGPAMGAFNAWTAGTFLADSDQRSAVQLALNLLEGAAQVTRAQQLRSHGVAVPAAAFDYRPRPLSLG